MDYSSWLKYTHCLAFTNALWEAMILTKTELWASGPLGTAHRTVSTLEGCCRNPSTLACLEGGVQILPGGVKLVTSLLCPQPMASLQICLA